MHEGLTYTSTNRFAGKNVTSSIRVLKLVPDREISIKSDSKVTIFWSKVEITQTDPSHCTVDVTLKLEFSKTVENMAHPLVEALIESNIREALEALSRQLA